MKHPNTTRPTLADTVVKALRYPKFFRENMGVTSLREEALHEGEKFILDAVSEAPRFILDDEFVYLAREMTGEDPDVLLECLRRSRCPYDKVFLEWNAEPMVTPDEPSSPDGFDESTHFTRYGVLIQRVSVSANAIKEVGEFTYSCTFFASTPDGSPSALSAGITFDPDSSEHVEETMLASAHMASGVPLSMKVAHSSMVTVGRVLLGPDYVDGFSLVGEENPEDGTIPDYWPEPLKELIVSSYANNAYPYGIVMSARILQLDPEFHAEYWTAAVLDVACMFRILISFLGLLNEPGTYDTRETEPEMRYLGERKVPHSGSHVVTLSRPRKTLLRRALKRFGEVIERKKHSVMGHFSYSRTKGDDDCFHLWDTLTPNLSYCTRCTMRRWWVKDHERGRSPRPWEKTIYIVEGSHE